MVATARAACFSTVLGQQVGWSEPAKFDGIPETVSASEAAGCRGENKSARSACGFCMAASRKNIRTYKVVSRVKHRPQELGPAVPCVVTHVVGNERSLPCAMYDLPHRVFVVRLTSQNYVEAGGTAIPLYSMQAH